MFGLPVTRSFCLLPNISASTGHLDRIPKVLVHYFMDASKSFWRRTVKLNGPQVPAGILLTRVFKQKLKALKKFIEKYHVFADECCWMYVCTLSSGRKEDMFNLLDYSFRQAFKEVERKRYILMADDDDDEGTFGGLFEDGHWIWDETTQALLFVSNLPPQPVESIQIQTKAPTGAVEFRDDVDLIEQVRYRRRYQRKLLPGQADLVTLQDVKDLALYTAPINILSPMLINLLHMPTTERFLRALILCCGYYLQVADEMAERMIELQTKVRTPMCDLIEDVFRDNLADLRVLVAKEYCIMLIGGAETKKFHHMGPLKKRRSLSDKDARLFETLLRMSIQIVWLALGRKSFNQIELETNRLFKSQIFNNVEHTLKTGYIAQMVPEEHNVLLGPCVRHDKKLNTRSPLMNEVFCDRPMDYRLTGLGVVRYPKMTTRLKYLRLMVAEAEDSLQASGVSLGIIGLPRSNFDTMLRPIVQDIQPSSKSKASSMTQQSYLKKKKKPLYPHFIIPEKDEIAGVFFPPSFPDGVEKSNPVSNIQHKRWLNRLTKLLGVLPQPSANRL